MPAGLNSLALLFFRIVLAILDSLFWDCIESID